MSVIPAKAVPRNHSASDPGSEGARGEVFVTVVGGVAPPAATPAVAWSLFGFGSRWSEATTAAVLEIDPVWPTRTVIVIVAELPTPRLPTVHAPVVEL